MDVYSRLVERRAQLHAAELQAAECRGLVRGLKMVAKRHPLLEGAEAQERGLAGQVEGLRGSVLELEAIVAELQVAQEAAAQAAAQAVQGLLEPAA